MRVDVIDERHARFNELGQHTVSQGYTFRRLLQIEYR